MKIQLTLEQVQSYSPCYTEEKLKSFFPNNEPREVTLESLLSLPLRDAVWLLSHLLPHTLRVQWANNSATRAAKTAAWAAEWAAWAAWAAKTAAEAAESATRAAESAAESAAWAAESAAESAAWTAADAARAAAESTAGKSAYKLAIEDGFNLLSNQ